MNGATAHKITVTYDVPDADESWELEEEDVPESAWHDAIIEMLKLVLRAWAARTDLNALICSNVALRWQREHWKIGVDPDVAVCIPAPPEGEDTTSICTWQPGHSPPRVAVEVVSRSTASKDYLSAPDRYAASGTNELWVFDPKRLGPKLHGGPYVLQVWHRDDAGSFRQVYRGKGPFRSPEIGAWLVVTDGGMRLRLADDSEGTRLWPTAAEEKEQQRALAEQKRALADQRATALDAEVSALRAELDRLRRGA
ncbi:MAG: Uma2 family endonuclease [Polyangiaceae bacterium]|nr:Uma2 family endonuclease [Polyangiaceae bacterium]